MTTPPRKLVLVVVDSLHPQMLQRAVAAERAPTLAALLDRGELVDDCVSSFPSVTPVCCAEIATGAGPDRHGICGMNWYHRVEHRYVEYGSSFEATRAFGLFRTLYDTVYNMNMAHLSHETKTFFERLGDAGVRTACTPFLIYRGRRRHELGLEGLLRRVAVAASFHHAVWGPDELFYGELYASRRVPCRPTLARPGTRDEYSACVARALVKDDLYDFLLFSLPDNDFHSHRRGPDATVESIAHADAALASLFEAGGGIDEFLERHAVIVMADHAQTAVERALPIAALLGSEWRVLEPNSERPHEAEIAVSPTARAAGVYVLLEGRRAARARVRLRERLLGTDGVDLVAWRADGGAEVAVRGARGELRFRPGHGARDRGGREWDLDGSLETVAAELRDGELASDRYPDVLRRLWQALHAPHAGDLIVSLEEGYECVDWGGAAHVGGGSHGSLVEGDSLCPLLLVGFDERTPQRHAQWSLGDVGELVLEHFGVAP